MPLSKVRSTASRVGLDAPRGREPTVKRALWGGIDIEHQRVAPHALRVGLAVGLATLVSHIAQLEDSWFAALAAITAMQPTLHTSFRSAIDSVIGAVFGAALGTAAAHVGSNQPWAVAATVVVALATAGWLRKDTIGNQAALVGAVIVLMPAQTHVQPIDYAELRLVQSLIGIGVALVVQVTIFPPKAHRKVRRELTWIYEAVAEMIERVGAGISGDENELEGLRKMWGTVEHRLADAGRLWDEAIREHGARHKLPAHWGETTSRITEQCPVLETAVLSAGSSEFLAALADDARALTQATSTCLQTIATGFQSGQMPRLPTAEVETQRAQLLHRARELEATRGEALYAETLAALAVVNGLNTIAQELVAAGAAQEQSDGDTPR